MQLHGKVCMVAGVVLCVATAPGLAQTRSREPVKPGGSVQAAVSVGFGDDEVRVIRDYYHKAAGRPRPLPPGIAKNLARGKPLPPGIAKNYLPVELSRRLTVRDGVEHVLAGDQVLMVRGGVVIDIVAIFK